MSNYIEKFLRHLSLLISGFFLVGYILYKLFDVSFFKEVSISMDNGTFVVIFISFLILCNLPNLIGIIKSIVRDKISEQTILELIPTIKDKLKADKNLIKELFSEQILLEFVSKTEEKLKENRGLIKELIDRYNKDKNEEPITNKRDLNK